MNRKYLVAVALLAVLAVVFGLAGTVAPGLELVSRNQSSSSSSDPVTHFMNPPTFDSGWVDIGDKCGAHFNITHDLNTTEVFVDAMGKQSLSGAGGEHQRNLGGTGIIPGWTQTYGGPYNDFARSMVQTNDGGYAIAGYTDSSGAQEYDMWLVKTDAAGNMQWNQTYGETTDEFAWSVVQTSDGGYAIAGCTWVGGALDLYDPLLVKFDSSGNVQWNQTYGTPSDNQAFSVVQTSDGGYAIAGCTWVGVGVRADYDFLLVKVDSDGTFQWNQTYGETTDEFAWSVVQTSDGGYAAAGRREFYQDMHLYDWDLLLVKFDSSGNMQWSRTYVGDYTWAWSVVQTSDGGYAAAGEIVPYGGTYEEADSLLVRFDSSGTFEWIQTYGGASWDEAYSVVTTFDRGYAIAGGTESFGAGDMDLWLIKTDESGNMQWNKTYRRDSDEFAYSVVQTSDGGYAMAGWAFSSHPIDTLDFLLVKTDVESGLAWTDSTADTITLYRGATDLYWNYVRVRIWVIEEPTWMFGDINQDGVVDINDLAILSRNYGKTFSLLSLTGIIAIVGIHTYKKRKQPK